MSAPQDNFEAVPNQVPSTADEPVIVSHEAFRKEAARVYYEMDGGPPPQEINSIINEHFWELFSVKDNIV